MTILYAISIISGILLALFRLIDSFQSKNDKETTNIFFTRLWENLENSKLNNLPLLSIKFFLKIPFLVKEFINNKFHFFFKALIIIIIPAMLIFTVLGVFGGFSGLINTFVLAICGFLLYSLMGDKMSKLLKIIVPIATVIFFSFGITELAVLIGGDLNWELMKRKENAILMLYWTHFNALFDILTVWFTIVLLKYVVNRKIENLIPIILLDILIAGFFAVGSLYFALKWTKNELELNEVLNVLVGLSTNGQNIELGSYFWAMHTTFIPTLFYLTFLVIAIIGKVIVLPFCKIFLKRHSVVEKPYYLTSAFFGFIGAFSLGIAKLIELYFDL